MQLLRDNIRIYPRKKVTDQRGWFLKTLCSRKSVKYILPVGWLVRRKVVTTILLPKNGSLSFRERQS